MNPGAQHALKSYQTVGAAAQVAAADPYRLVQLMLANVLSRLAAARGHLERGEIAAKAEQISKTVAVLNALDSSLNHDKGGEIAANLHGLYEYSVGRLAEANLNNDAAGVDEVIGIVRNIKDGWDGISDSAGSVRGGR